MSRKTLFMILAACVAACGACRNRIEGDLKTRDVHVIGAMTVKEKGLRLQSGDNQIPIQFKGWDHFKK